MRLHHTFDVALPGEEAWAVLTDVERVGPCLPGASITRAAGDEFGGRVKVKVGPISAEYAGEGRFVSREPAAGLAVLEARGRETRGKGGASAEVKPVPHGRRRRHPRRRRHRPVDLGQARAVRARGHHRRRGPAARAVRGQPGGPAPAAPDTPVVDLATRAWPDDEPLDSAPADQVTSSPSAPGPAGSEKGDPAAGGDLQMLSVIALPVAKRAAHVVGGALLAWLVWSGWRRSR